MHLQKLRQPSALHLPSTRQRNDGHHENQHEAPGFSTSGSSAIFPTRLLSKKFMKGFTQTTAIAVAVATFCAPQLLNLQVAEAKPTAKTAAAKPVGTWGRTTGSSTYVRIRPGTQTPIIAKVAKGTQLMVWGTYDGWYRVETTDHKFGWIYNTLVNVPLANKLQELSHAKAKQASDRTGHQVMYGDAATLRSYYAKYQAPGAKVGLQKQGVSLVAAKPAVAAPKPVVVRSGVPAMPREVSITTAEPQVHHARPVEATIEAKVVEVKAVEARVVTPVVKTVPQAKPVTLASRKGAPRQTGSTSGRPVQLEATTLEPMSPSKLPQISAADIMAARRAHIQRQQLSSRHQTRPRATKSSANSTIKTAPAAKPVKQTKGKFQPTSAQQIENELTALNLTPEEAEIIGDAYYIAAAKKAPAKAAPSRGGSPRDYATTQKGQANGAMAQRALSYRGMPYIRGASSPSRGFDCSGLIYHLLRSRGFNPPRTAAAYAKYGQAVAKKDLKPGDLVLFANTYKRGISHIGIYIGNNNFVHAANKRSGVKTDSLGSSYYSKKYYGARRVQ